MWPIFDILRVTVPFLIIALIIANLGSMFWKVKNFTPSYEYKGYVDKFIRKYFPRY